MILRVMEISGHQEYYGNDPYGPTPLDSDNNVVVEEIDLGENYLLQ